MNKFYEKKIMLPFDFGYKTSYILYTSLTLAKRNKNPRFATRGEKYIPTGCSKKVTIQIYSTF